MKANDSNLADEIANEEDCEQAFEFWSDEGALLFKQMLEEGSAYLEESRMNFVDLLIRSNVIFDRPPPAPRRWLVIGLKSRCGEPHGVIGLQPAQTY